MYDFTFEQIFQRQLETTKPLDQDSSYVKEHRKDIFDYQFQPGDVPLMVLLIKGKFDYSANTTMDFAYITPRSWESLLHHYRFEPHYDSRTHTVIMNDIPRFVQKPTQQQIEQQQEELNNE